MKSISGEVSFRFFGLIQAEHAPGGEVEKCAREAKRAVFPSPFRGEFCAPTLPKDFNKLQILHASTSRALPLFSILPVILMTYFPRRFFCALLRVCTLRAST